MEPEPRIYRIRRYHFGGRTTTIRNNVTRTEALEYCSRPDTWKAGKWFDGFAFMPGCRPEKE